MNQDRRLPSERQPLTRPQIYVHLEFGMSWSERHSPNTHTVTYTSRNLRDSRAPGAFPRQLPPANTNFLALDSRPYRPRDPRELTGYYQPQQQSTHMRNRSHQDGWWNESTLQPGRMRPHHQNHHQQQEEEHQRSRQRGQNEHGRGHRQRESRSESRGGAQERGKSAPPPFHDSPWDAVPGPSSSLFPPGPQARAEQPGVGKPLPAAPSRFRLGEDGLPWSAWAWPVDPHDPEQGDETEDAPPYANQPTTVAISPLKSRGDDPDRTRELESLSAAMMTVDNGFENQWWYQGERENVAWWPRDQEEPARMSMADAVLLSAAEPPVDGWYAPSAVDDRASYLDAIVSPISTVSGSPVRPLHRSMTTRSEELFFTSTR
jgi:hypothetical protein